MGERERQRPKAGSAKEGKPRRVQGPENATAPEAAGARRVADREAATNEVLKRVYELFMSGSKATADIANIIYDKMSDPSSRKESLEMLARTNAVLVDLREMVLRASGISHSMYGDFAGRVEQWSEWPRPEDQTEDDRARMDESTASRKE